MTFSFTTHWSFRKCPLSRRNSSRRPPFSNCLGSQAIFSWSHSVRLEIEGKERNLQLTLHPSQSQQNVLFASDYPLHYLHCYHLRSLEHFWLKIIRLKSSHNPEWWLKGLSKANETKSLGWIYVKKTGSGCWVLFKMAGTMSSFGLHWSGISRGKSLLALTKNIGFFDDLLL